MEEDMMNMQVSPVMQPEQPMMQGTPAPQELPGELQQELFQLSSYITRELFWSSYISNNSKKKVCNSTCHTAKNLIK